MKRTISVEVADAEAYAGIVAELLALQEQGEGAIERISWTCGEDINHLLKADGWTPKWKKGSVHGD